MALGLDENRGERITMGVSLRLCGISCSVLAAACGAEPQEAALDLGRGAQALSAAPAPPDGAQSPYTLFEALQVRPLALSPDGRFLFAVNTPDNRLEILRVSDRGLASLGSVSVGLEPVAVA